MKLEIVLASLFLLITTRQNTPPHCLEGNGFVQGPYGIWGTLFCVTVCSVPAAVCALIPLKTVSSYVVCTRTYVLQSDFRTNAFGIFFSGTATERGSQETAGCLAPGMTTLSDPLCSALAPLARL